MKSPIVAMPLLRDGPPDQVLPVVGSPNEDATVTRQADRPSGRHDDLLRAVLPRLVSQGVTFHRLDCHGKLVFAKGETHIASSWTSIPRWPAGVDLSVDELNPTTTRLQLQVSVGRGTQLEHVPQTTLAIVGCPDAYSSLATKAGS